LLFALAIAIASCAVLLPSRGAHADPIDDKRAQAKALQDQIDANGARIDALSEQYNGAQYHLEQAETAAATAQQHIEATRAKVAELKDIVARRAAALYRRSGTGEDAPNLDPSDATTAARRSKLTSIAEEQDQRLLDQLHANERQLHDQEARAEAARADAQAEKDRITHARTEIEAANVRQQELLSQVNGEIAQLVAEEAARREAEAQAQARARYAAAVNANTDANRPTTTTAGHNGSTANGGGGASGGNADPGNPRVPVAGGAAQAIAFAQAQVGRPYCFGGAGPGCYDCSGLTMAAWGSAGVPMPHFSGAQYDMFPHVPLSALQPGDLVFWGPGGSQHVGLYMGGGQMIAAPHTGDVVKVQAVYGHPTGAARPG
jgi:cell wall-associated NlpC family hydrolase